MSETRNITFEKISPILIFITGLHEIHSIDKIVHRLALLFSRNVRMRLDLLPFLVHKVFQGGKRVLPYIVCKWHLKAENGT